MPTPTLLPRCPCACAAIAGSTNMSSLVVMSKGTRFTQQSYKVSGERWVASAVRAAGCGSEQQGCKVLGEAPSIKTWRWNRSAVHQGVGADVRV